MPMDEKVLYRRIAEHIRKEILSGRLQPGDRLPPIREMTRRWNCTPGTIQHAYQELALHGLVISQAGQGTHVSGTLNHPQVDVQTPLRQASLVNRAESFLLEMFAAGYTQAQIDQALEIARDRWRAADKKEAAPTPSQVLRFAGSHDMAVIWLASRIQHIAPGASLQINFNGSLGGLMTLAEGKAELAGCHLLEVESGTYNEPYLRKLFPGQSMLTVRLANRRLGLFTPPGNPRALHGLGDLHQPGLRFANRQAGSGTRVWLDAQLHRLGLSETHITGFEDEKRTHSEVARAIAEGSADAGIGLQSAALAFGLDFIPLVEEPYDLVLFQQLADHPVIQKLLDWLANPASCLQMAHLKGYDFSQTGTIRQLTL